MDRLGEIKSTTKINFTFFLSFLKQNWLLEVVVTACSWPIIFLLDGTAPQSIYLHLSTQTQYFSQDLINVDGVETIFPVFIFCECIPLVLATPLVFLNFSKKDIFLKNFFCSTDMASSIFFPVLSLFQWVSSLENM